MKVTNMTHNKYAIANNISTSGFTYRAVLELTSLRRKALCSTLSKILNFRQMRQCKKSEDAIYPKCRIVVKIWSRQSKTEWQ